MAMKSVKSLFSRFRLQGLIMGGWEIRIADTVTVPYYFVHSFVMCLSKISCFILELTSCLKISQDKTVHDLFNRKKD